MELHLFNIEEKFTLLIYRNKDKQTAILHYLE